MRSRTYWIVCLVCIIGLGIASCVVHTGWIILDKYAGDALYAAMVYVLISLVWQMAQLRKAVLAMLIMTALEVFQLTMIPAHMLASGNLAERILARLLGTEFSFRDLLAFAVGILGVFLLDRASITGPLSPTTHHPPPTTLFSAIMVLYEIARPRSALCVRVRLRGGLNRRGRDHRQM